MMMMMMMMMMITNGFFLSCVLRVLFCLFKVFLKKSQSRAHSKKSDNTTTKKNSPLFLFFSALVCQYQNTHISQKRVSII